MMTGRTELMIWNADILQQRIDYWSTILWHLTGARKLIDFLKITFQDVMVIHVNIFFHDLYSLAFGQLFVWSTAQS